MVFTTCMLLKRAAFQWAYSISLKYWALTLWSKQRCPGEQCSFDSSNAIFRRRILNSHPVQSSTLSKIPLVIWIWLSNLCLNTLLSQPERLISSFLNVFANLTFLCLFCFHYILQKQEVEYFRAFNSYFGRARIKRKSLTNLKSLCFSHPFPCGSHFHDFIFSPSFLMFVHVSINIV